MTSIKVRYFDIPARGEPIRLLLVYGGEDFENDKVDVRKWPEIKQTLTFGQVPVYEENGHIINQTTAIIRYLGRKYKLGGNTEWESLEIDSVADNYIDFQQKILQWHYIKSANKKKECREVLVNETIPFYLERMEKIAKENGGHLALKRLTWADFFFAGMIDYFSWMADLDLLKNYPSLKAVKENVLNLPMIKKWYENNPVNMEVSKFILEFTGKCTED
nr:glutathione S-transferase-like [Onthophagus taurus]